MPRRAPEIDHPAIIVIPDDTEGSMDDWLASLPRDEPPIELPVHAAQLIAEVRLELE